MNINEGLSIALQFLKTYGYIFVPPWGITLKEKKCLPSHRNLFYIEELPPLESKFFVLSEQKRIAIHIQRNRINTFCKKKKKTVGRLNRAMAVLCSAVQSFVLNVR